MSSISPVVGRPGVYATTTATFGMYTADGKLSHKPGGGVVDGSDSRDPGNTGSTYVLRAGTLMAKHGTTGRYAPWVIGVTTGALTGVGTSINIGAASAAELIRRHPGSSGTLTLTGPPTANGTARQMTVSYSGVDTGTGAITITALGVNQVERVRLNVAATGGNIQLNVQKPDGTFVTTANAAWSATDATFLAAINSALDTATGVVGGIVASAIAATDTDLGFTLTYSGGAYAGRSWEPAKVVVYPTSSTSHVTELVTVAVNGAFVAGSVVSSPTNYTTPVTLIDEGNGLYVPTDDTDVDFPRIPMAGAINVSRLPYWPTDTGLADWIKGRMDAVGGNKFVFVDSAI